MVYFVSHPQLDCDTHSRWTSLPSAHVDDPESTKSFEGMRKQAGATTYLAQEVSEFQFLRRIFKIFSLLPRKMAPITKKKRKMHCSSAHFVFLC